MLIRKLPLFEMARSRKKVIELIEGLQTIYEEHLLKCVIYGNSTDNVWHWAGEVAEVLVQVNGMKAKTSSGKLSSQDYIDNLLLASGEFDYEYKENLKHFQFKYKYKYPKFEITDKLVENTVDLFKYMALKYSKYLNNPKYVANKDFIRQDILDFLELREIIGD